MRRILVTGANKGIGLALVEAILAQHADTVVYLGARDAGRGRAAAAALLDEHAGWKGRLEVVELDVSDDASVARAREQVGESARGEALYALVNNAGIGDRTQGLAAVLATNTFGVWRVCEAFLPIVERIGGRIVNVTSASGPTFVAACTPEWQRFFLDERMTWQRLRTFLEQCLATGDAAALAAQGLADGSAYGLSKAAANAYTAILAREQPALLVNACTPGFIATDLTRHYAESQNKSPAELGMKTPADGAKAPLHLLFGAVHGSGHYYGSDAKRSPLDRYRAPGSPEYSGGPPAPRG